MFRRGNGPRSRRLAGGVAVALVLALAGVVPAAQAGTGSARCPWVGSHAPIDRRVDQVLDRMTLDEKIGLLGLAASPDGYENYFPAVPRLCVPRLTLQDGPAGVAAGFTHVTQLPAPIALAATWDRSAARRYGRVQGTESWGKGIEVAQGPDVNIARVPENGRSFEAYGEDPYLVGRIGVADIEGIQGTGVMADVKHLAANNQETDRDTIDERIDERTLREIYLPAFRAAVRDGHVATGMCAYNKINGEFACQDKGLMTDVFKNEWEFSGFIRSDYGAVHDVAASYDAGMDQAKPGAGPALTAAVRAGTVPVSRIDDAGRRVMRKMFAYGLFDRQPKGTPDSVVTSAAHTAQARRTSESGTVLLKNAAGLLPLSGRAARSIAVIGPDGDVAPYTAGGGSAHVVRSPDTVSTYAGIKARAGDRATVTYAQGTTDGGYEPVATSALTPRSGAGHGLSAQYFNTPDLSGDPVLSRVDPNVQSVWGFDGEAESPGPGVSTTNWSARWSGTLTAPVSGTYTFSLTSDDGGRMSIGGTTVVDNWTSGRYHTRTGTITLRKGIAYPIRVEYHNGTGGGRNQLGWQLPGRPHYSQAVAAARAADVAVVSVNDEEFEGVDRTSLALPYRQDALVDAVAAANPRTVVVLHTGGPVTMPWLPKVRGVLEAWYPGQQGGAALARVLFGDTDPSGRLPLTFPVDGASTPIRSRDQWPGVGGTAVYRERLEVGYRWYDSHRVAPLFPFGAGLSYTTFALHGLAAHSSRTGAVSATTTVTNTGRRSGTTVAQLYVGLPRATGEPPRQLKGFRKLTLAPHHGRRVTFTVPARDLAHWDTRHHRWTTTAGTYTLSVGTSSRALAATTTIRVPATRTFPD